MTTKITLTPSETRYFQGLSSEKLSVVRIGFKNICNQLELDSEDARSTLVQLHCNFTTWDKTEEGKAGWSPLLNSLRDYLNQPKPPSQELQGRIIALQDCLPKE